MKINNKIAEKSISHMHIQTALLAESESSGTSSFPIQMLPQFPIYVISYLMPVFYSEF